jgi:hypothetical protein
VNLAPAALVPTRQLPRQYLQAAGGESKQVKSGDAASKWNYRPYAFSGCGTSGAAQLGIRGAWVAGGIETSFPLAHGRLSFSPVQFATAENEDRSATDDLGGVDRVIGMDGRTAHSA